MCLIRNSGRVCLQLAINSTMTEQAYVNSVKDAESEPETSIAC